MRDVTFNAAAAELATARWLRDAPIGAQAVQMSTHPTIDPMSFVYEKAEGGVWNAKYVLVRRTTRDLPAVGVYDHLDVRPAPAKALPRTQIAAGEHQYSSHSWFEPLCHECVYRFRLDMLVPSGGDAR